MRSIRSRLVLMLLVGLAAVLSVGGAAVYWIAEASLVRQLDAGVCTRAQALASLVTFDDGSIEFELDEGDTDTLEGVCFEYRSLAGSLLRRSATLDERGLPVRRPEEGTPIISDIVLPDGTPGRCVWLAFRPRVDFEIGTGRRPDLLVVAAAIDRRTVDTALSTLLGALAGVGAVVGLTVIILVAAGVRWGLSPLDELSRLMGDVDGSTISTRFESSGVPRELRPIYGELNRLLDRVERTIDRERSFADAAAHELRTPLAELRSTAEVAIRWPETDRALTALHEVLAIGREMEQLVASLLQLSRGAAGAIGRGEADVPLAPIVDACLGRAAETIRAKNLQLDVHLNGARLRQTPADAAEIIVRNLIDNAVQYTPAGGAITILGTGSGSSDAFVVENDATHLTEADVPRLFEPFWRTDRSRSDREHAGLGLAVVQQIAQATGLRVDAGLHDARLRIAVSAAAIPSEARNPVPIRR